MIKSGSMYDKRLKKKREMQKKGMLSGGQAKIAAKAPPTNKIDAKDFAVLRAEKAKGRGQGLQDEKMKPGKVMKAKRGRRIKKDPTKTVNPFEKKSSKFLERRKKLAGVKSLVGKAGRIGLLGAALGVAGAGAAKLGQTIGRKMSEKKNKKMGGGMMKRPAMKKGGMSAGDKFNAKVKGMLDTYDDKNTPMKKDRFKEKLKASGKMGGGMMKRPMAYTKGGGADTGRKGEFMSKLGVAINKIKRDRPTRPDLKKLPRKMGGGMMMLMKKAKDKGAKPLEFLSPMAMLKRVQGKNIGGMMNKPMGYKAGKSVKAKCKLGRNKPTKMY